MTIDFQTQTAVFDPFKGDLNSRVLTFSFPTSVTRAVPVISGFNIEYTDSDHHLGQELIQVPLDSVNIHGNLGELVDVTVLFLLRDSSGNIDDRYDGSVDVTLLVERE